MRSAGLSADEATTNADDLLARGDAAMYEAKAQGPGRVCIAPAEEHPGPAVLVSRLT